MIQKSKEINKLSALYLKQFFYNHTIKNKQAQSINFLSSSLQVLDQLFNNFMQKHHISSPITQNSQIKDLNLQQKQENLAVQFGSLYQKVKNLLQWTENVLQKSKFVESSHQFSQYKSQYQLTSSREASDRWSYERRSKNSDVNDEQLYQMLNQYKKTNKKNKETIQVLTKKIQETKNQYLEIKIKKQIIEKQSVYLNSRIQELQNQLDLLQDQIEKSKIENNANSQQICRLTKTVAHLQSNIRQITSQNIENVKILNTFKSNYNKVLQQKAQLQEKLQQAYQKTHQRMKNKINQLPQLIQNKLKDKKYWNLASVQILTKYVKYSNKQNFSQNNFRAP